MCYKPTDQNEKYEQKLAIISQSSKVQSLLYKNNKFNNLIIKYISSLSFNNPLIKHINYIK